jgi:hypothetical protein
MLHFPTRVFNERVAVFVDSFYEEMARLFRAQGWSWEEPRRTEAAWRHPDFAVRIAGRYKDGAIRTLELKALNLPGVGAVEDSGRVHVRSEHRFRIELPRAYPGDLGAILVRATTSLFHPRIGPSGRGHACVYVNGEIDRVLWSIIRQILLDPDYVQPPKLYRGQDRGMNLLAMNWYETDPRGIHQRLLDLWAQAHGAREFAAAQRKTGSVTINP